MKIIFQATKYKILEWTIDRFFSTVNKNFNKPITNQLLPDQLKIGMRLNIQDAQNNNIHKNFTLYSLYHDNIYDRYIFLFKNRHDSKLYITSYNNTEMYIFTEA